MTKNGRLSKRDALRLCRKLWECLAENPGKNKEWALDKLGIHRSLACNCPCCEYNNSRGELCGDGDRPCGQGCLLKSLWPKGCLSEKSPFSKWDWSGYADYKSAMKIANACKELLDGDTR